MLWTASHNVRLGTSCAITSRAHPFSTTLAPAPASELISKSSLRGTRSSWLVSCNLSAVPKTEADIGQKIACLIHESPEETNQHMPSYPPTIYSCWDLHDHFCCSMGSFLRLKHNRQETCCQSSLTYLTFSHCVVTKDMQHGTLLHLTKSCLNVSLHKRVNSYLRRRLVGVAREVFMFEVLPWPIGWSILWPSGWWMSEILLRVLSSLPGATYTISLSPVSRLRSIPSGLWSTWR